MWPIKEKENRQLLIYSSQVIGIRRYGSLININLSGSYEYLYSYRALKFL